MVPATMPHEELPDGLSEPVLIGSGLGARVYRARDDVLGRMVAVKLFRQHWAEDPQRRERFLAECAVATRLGAHPAVATIHSAGITPGGQPWMCMEWAAGGSVAAALRDGPLEPARALRLAAVVADCLAWAHSLDPPVFHRDVKPGNILLAEPDRPLLADFGVSTSVGHAQSSVTAQEFTQLYAAPEVLQSGRFGAASEVWSLTATLFEMMTGDPPFPTGDGEGVGAFIARVHAGLPEAAIPAGVPAPIADLLREGLVVDRAERLATVADWAVRIRQVQAALGHPLTPPAGTPAPTATSAWADVPGAGVGRAAVPAFDEAVPDDRLTRPRDSRPGTAVADPAGTSESAVVPGAGAGTAAVLVPVSDETDPDETDPDPDDRLTRPRAGRPGSAAAAPADSAGRGHRRPRWFWPAVAGAAAVTSTVLVVFLAVVWPWREPGVSAGTPEGSPAAAPGAFVGGNPSISPNPESSSVSPPSVVPSWSADEGAVSVEVEVGKDGGVQRVAGRVCDEKSDGFQYALVEIRYGVGASSSSYREAGSASTVGNFAPYCMPFDFDVPDFNAHVEVCLVPSIRMEATVCRTVS
jgi:serine/threonine protein kinase